MLRVQIRAALRASVHGYLKIMFPMVGSLDDIRYVRFIIEEEKRKLEQEKIKWSPSLQIGIMIEVPSVAMIAELVAKEVDFVSVGTNDLTQYLCAADRMNPQVRRYYQEYHPAVFRVLAHLSQTFQAAGKDISICGELGGDPLALPVLLGIGINQFSMGSASLARAKRTIRSLDMEIAKNLARQVLTMGTHEEITECLQKFSREHKEMS